MTFNGKRIGNRILVKKMRDVSNRRACKLTKTRSNYRGLGHFFPFPFSFSLSRFTCIESGKLRNAVNRKMTKQFSLALIMNENKLGRQVCVYILLICAGCVIIRWPRWVEHTISNRLLRAERMSPAYTAIAADRANNFRQCVQTFRKFTCYENVPFIYKYFWFERLRIHPNVYWKMILSETYSPIKSIGLHHREINCTIRSCLKKKCVFCVYKFHIYCWRSSI